MLSRRVQKTVTPIIGDLRRLAAEVQREGRAVISLGQGIPAFDPPATALEATRNALAEPSTHKYSLDAGLPDARRAIAEKIAHDRGVRLDPDREIIITAGGNQAAILALMTTTDPDDEVLLPGPYYFNHEMAVGLTGGIPVEAPLREEDGFALHWERLEPYITKRTRVAFLLSPNNPTGAVYAEAALVECARKLIERGITPIVDETYEYFVYGSTQHASLLAHDDLRPHIISLGSFSKTFGMSGWRLGYACAPAEVIAEGVKVQDTLVICAPVISQRALTGALAGDFRSDLQAQIKEVNTRRLMVRDMVDSTPALRWTETYGAFYAFIHVTTSQPIDTVVRDLIRQSGVLVLPGTAFGSYWEGYIRLSYGAVDTPILTDALQRLHTFFESKV